MPRVAQGQLKRLGIRKDERDPVMKNIGRKPKRFLVESDGFESIEYSVMTALIVGAVVIALVLMMVVITDTFADVAILI